MGCQVVRWAGQPLSRRRASVWRRGWVTLSADLLSAVCLCPAPPWAASDRQAVAGSRVWRSPRPAASIFETVVIPTNRSSPTVPTRQCLQGPSRLRQAPGGEEPQAKGAAQCLTANGQSITRDERRRWNWSNAWLLRGVSVSPSPMTARSRIGDASSTTRSGTAWNRRQAHREGPTRRPGPGDVPRGGPHPNSRSQKPQVDVSVVPVPTRLSSLHPAVASLREDKGRSSRSGRLMGPESRKSPRVSASLES